MKAIAIVVGAIVLAVLALLVVKWSPLFLNSRIERVGEKNLPRIVVEKGGIICCRMRADDFRFPLPPGSRAANPVIIKGGFDTVDGSVEAVFEGTNTMTTTDYVFFLMGKVPVGGEVTPHTIPGGLLIKFHYFGDR